MSATAAAHLLTRDSHRRRAAPPLEFLPGLTLDRARVHEICGASRRMLALAVSGRVPGTLLWIRPNWMTGRLNPGGILRFVDPSRLVIVAPRRPEDVLWTMEEALRTGVLPLVVADLPACPGLTAVRRLHLAAEAGAAAGPTAPVGLVLTPGEGGAPGVETRWSLAPRHGPNGTEGWDLARLRARTRPQKHWRLEGDATGMRLAEPA